MRASKKERRVKAIADDALDELHDADCDVILMAVFKEKNHSENEHRILFGMTQYDKLMHDCDVFQALYVLCRHSQEYGREIMHLAGEIARAEQLEDEPDIVDLDEDPRSKSLH